MKKRVKDGIPINLKVKTKKFGMVNFYLRADKGYHLACFEIPELSYSKPLSLSKVECAKEPYTFNTIILKCIDIAMKERYNHFIEKYKKLNNKKNLDIEEMINVGSSYKLDWIYTGLVELKKKVRNSQGYIVSDGVYYLENL